LPKEKIRHPIFPRRPDHQVDVRELALISGPEVTLEHRVSFGRREIGGFSYSLHAVARELLGRA
jgi:hypothetical protein